MYKVSIGSLCLVVVIIISYVMIFGYTTHYIHAQDKSTLQLSTNKKTYKPGETVTITLKNNGKSTLEFSDSSLGLTIQNMKTHQKAGMFGSQVMSEIKPGGSKTIQWDQKDYDGKQVQSGTYNAKTSSATEENSNNTSPIAVSTTFTIK
jgi:FtsP/CotA-like multicopper oxidase with cupredoxin domain